MKIEKRGKEGSFLELETVEKELNSLETYNGS